VKIFHVKLVDLIWLGLYVFHGDLKRQTCTVSSA